MLLFRLDQLAFPIIQLLISCLRERCDQTSKEEDERNRELPWPTRWQTFHTNDGTLVLSIDLRVLFGFPRRAIDQRLKLTVLSCLRNIGAANYAEYRRDKRLCKKPILHGVNLKKFGEFLSGHPNISCCLDPVFQRNLYIKVYAQCPAEKLKCKLDTALWLLSSQETAKAKGIEKKYKKAARLMDEKRMVFVQISQVEGKQVVHIDQNRKPYVDDLISPELPTLEREIVRFKAIYGLFNQHCPCPRDQLDCHF